VFATTIIINTKYSMEDVVYDRMLFYWALPYEIGSFHCVLKTSLIPKGPNVHTADKPVLGSVT
jgi:hypothetical protein